MIDRDELADYIITANRYALSNYYAWVTYDEASDTMMIASAPSADVPYNRAYPDAVTIYHVEPYTLYDIYGPVTIDGVDTSTDEFRAWYLYDGLDADNLAINALSAIGL